MTSAITSTAKRSPVKLNTIYDTSTLTAFFSIDDNSLTGLDNKQTVNPGLNHIPLEFSDSIKHQYYGDLSYVSPALNTSTGTLQLKCHIKNSYDELKPGMFVKVNLPYKAIKDAILVKDASIGTDQAGKYLYVVNDSNKIVYTPIEVGQLYRDSLRVVLSGLSPESRYVTKALLKVRNGMEVKPHVVK